MDGERLRNLKEHLAKFQKFDASSLPGPIKFPAGVLKRVTLETHYQQGFAPVQNASLIKPQSALTILSQ